MFGLELTLNKDITPNRYYVDEEQYPKSATQFVVRKRKAVTSPTKLETMGDILEEEE